MGEYHKEQNWRHCRSRVKGDAAEKCFESAPMKEETIVNNLNQKGLGPSFGTIVITITILFIISIFLAG